jgi:thioredoxin-dependent peroxiredoxin
MSEQERQGVITFKGNPFTLLGPDLKVGDKAPEFTVLANDLSPVTLADSKGKTRLLVAVPSIDTPVCDTEVRRFNQEAAKLPNVEVITISMDLPFAQKRWCGAAGIEQVKTVSDHREASFGKAYGVLIKELKLEARAIFVIDANDKIVYKEIVSEVTNEPNYEAALKAAGAELAGTH